MSEIVEPSLKTFPTWLGWGYNTKEFVDNALEWKEDFEAKLLKQCEQCQIHSP